MVQTLLPASVALYSYLDAAKDLLLASLEIYAELNNISVINGVCATFHSGTAETDMIEKGARTTLDVFDVPLATLAPQFAMLATDYLAFKSNGGGRKRVGKGVSCTNVPLGKSAHFDSRSVCWESTSDNGKGQ